jgi:hypothetical protein
MCQAVVCYYLNLQKLRFLCIMSPSVMVTLTEIRDCKGVTLL